MVGLFPKSGWRFELCALNDLYNGTYQVPESDTGDRLCAATAVHALNIEGMHKRW